jgi:hypothetical protein
MIQVFSRDEIIAYKAGATVFWQAGKGLEVRTSAQETGQTTIQAVTRAYSKAAVSWAASRAGWTVKQNADNTLTVNRR